MLFALPNPKPPALDNVTEILSVDDEPGQLQSLVDCCRRARTPANFEPLVRALMPRVRGVLYNLVLNREDMDDLAQETWVAAYEQFERFDGASSFGTWVCGIAVKKALQFMRNRRRRDELRAEHEDLVHVGLPTPAPDTQLMGREEEDRVTEAVASLSPELRAAIVLTAVEQMTPAEAGKACGCSMPVFYWRLYTARRQLTRILERRK
ncbi:MAG: RNA polymerase sigma factor [Candidatus Methylacidiphilales bacterium]|nr:RNA polymerase sigma factor [Candidatus Methylacidiphilales bacterium]